ncbi:stage V sporulation protein E [Paenibacillus sp. J31TS4]|uniref:putative lipid II flippase FtsW n=1 Tax=Paenibacillus sp. J31TS4 TaxID=2807195 RepID=UPI001B10F40E|nr:putative lipid II flippase FtsW [Paenibacillus sp. J31TS4]GIP39788.1 stage V sporulation protein E [Paenibacillus sp. J31TS4]
MNPPKRGTPDFLLLILTFVLALFGLLMVYSASSMTSSYYNEGNSFVYFKRHAIAMALGFFAMLIGMNLRYQALRKWVAPFFLVVLVLLVLVPFFGNGKVTTGANSWFSIGPFNLQPTEFAKLAIILYLANLISKKGEKFRDFKKGLLPALIIIGTIAGLIMLQPDFGSCAVLVGGCLFVLVVGGANLKHLAMLGGAGLVLGGLVVGLAIMLSGGLDGYRVDRFRVFLDPWVDPLGIGFQIIQSLFAFGHGGLTGAGFGQSIQKLHYLPEAHNDFIFAIVGEELGFIGTSIFLLVYLLFLWRGIIVSLRSTDAFGMITGIGIVSMIGIQALINIGGVTNSIPMTGVTLPFISYGGSSILATLAGMGILLGISREQNRPVPPPKANTRSTGR